MVGHDVGDEAEAVGPQGRDEARAPLGAAELTSDAGRVDHVVAVPAAGHRLEDRRAIDVRDPESRQIRDDAGGLVEVEVRLQMEPVCGAEVSTEEAGCTPCSSPETERYRAAARKTSAGEVTRH